MKKYLFVSASAVLFFASFTFAAHAQCGPDGTQPCNTPKAKAAAAKSTASKQPAKPKTTTPSKSKKSDLDKLDSMKVKTPAKKPDNESVFRSLQLEPQAVKNNGAAKEMLPLNGVTPGQTTEAQLRILNGQRKTYVDATTKETKVYYTVKDTDFWLENGVVSYVSLFSVDLMPQRWRDLGFNWNLSFNQYLALLDNLGFQIDYKLPPPQSLSAGQTFTGRVAASKKEGIPMSLSANFLFTGDKPSVNSSSTLFYLVVRPPK